MSCVTMGIFIFAVLFETYATANGVKLDPTKNEPNYGIWVEEYFSVFGDVFFPDDGTSSSFRFGMTHVWFAPNSEAQDVAASVLGTSENTNTINKYPGIGLALGALSVAAYQLPGNLRAYSLGLGTVPRTKNTPVILRFAYTMVEDGEDFNVHVLNGEILTSMVDAAIEPYLGLGAQIGRGTYEPSGSDTQDYIHSWTQGYALAGLRFSLGPFGLATQVRGNPGRRQLSLHAYLHF